jgi:hypothetical protein
VISEGISFVRTYQTNHSQSTVNLNKKEIEVNQGGFMPILHSFEKECYGPKSTLDNKSKVFLCIRHKSLSFAHVDGILRKAISKGEIIEATGVEKSGVERILSKLEKENMILVHRSKTGKVWNENQYEINPKLFGNDFVYKPEKPTLTVYEGGKSEKSYPQPKNKTESKKEDLPASERADLPASERADLPADIPLRRGSNSSKLKANFSPNNSLNNFKELSPEDVDNSTSSDVDNPEKKREIFLKKISKKFKVSLLEVSQVWNQWATQDKDLLGRPIIDLGALLLNSYPKLKEALQSPYNPSSRSLKQESEEEEMIDHTPMPDSVKQMFKLNNFH